MTFCYTLFTFIWMVVSPWRWKLPAYVGLMALGLFAMPGPTLLLMLLLVLQAELDDRRPALERRALQPFQKGGHMLIHIGSIPIDFRNCWT